MSKPLADYLETTLREPLYEAVGEVIRSFGTTEYNAEETPQEAQARFTRELADAITDEVVSAVSLSVQQYLRAHVTTNYSLVTLPANGPMPHFHVIPPLTLNSP